MIFKQSNIFKRVFLIAYDWFIRPLSKDEDDQRKEFILNILLFSLIVLFGCLALVVVYSSLSLGSQYHGAILQQMLIPLAVFIGMYALSRSGFARFVAVIFVWALYSLILFAVWRWGLGLPQAWLFCALAISFAAQLIGTSYSFIVTIALCLAFALVVQLQQDGILVPDLSWQNRPFLFSDVFGASATFFVFTIVSWLSNREISGSLKRARTSEALLKEERDSLEIKVEERTRELVEEQEARLHEIERFAEFGQLASGIMHDLANPLTAISLNLDLAGNNPHVKEAVSATHRMETLLRTARKQFVRTDDKSQFNIADEIEQAVILLTQKAKGAQVRIDTDDVEQVRTLGLPIKFFRVMMNVISNAVDAYQESDQAIEDRVVHVRCHVQDDHATIRVEDHGSGIPKEYLDKIFLPFFTTKTGSGSGFGLSMAKEIIENDFGGTIAVESEADAGTVFIIDLPIRSE